MIAPAVISTLISDTYHSKLTYRQLGFAQTRHTVRYFTSGTSEGFARVQGKRRLMTPLMPADLQNFRGAPPSPEQNRKMSMKTRRAERVHEQTSPRDIARAARTSWNVFNLKFKYKVTKLRVRLGFTYLLLRKSSRLCYLADRPATCPLSLDKRLFSE